MSEIFNAAEYLVDRHVAAGRGEATAVISDTGRLSYKGLRDLAAAVAAGLRVAG